ncbi:MAG: 7-carboxy-7-deazaguanine synthase QueE [Chloroflexi bacterium]|nr:7-carboxy-7-deazaguanine synthase QueE [Chloroflexota bacterium]
MKVSEIFYSIQGEGANSGTPMVFVRLAGCNLRCDFCDTDYAFDGGRELDEAAVLKEVAGYPAKWVCVTGGEPMLQDVGRLIDMLKGAGRSVQVETNGTVFQETNCDWLVLSPKRGKPPVEEMLERANEIKLVVDSPEILERACDLEPWGSAHSVQPVSNRSDVTSLCVEFVKANPRWRLSVQVHKLIAIK